MADFRTLTEFQEALDKEMAWRVKEIGVFNSLSRKNEVENRSFVRAGVALTYTHWEGFVKTSSEIYLDYIRCKNLSYRKLKTCFAVFGLKYHLRTLIESKKSISNRDALDFVIDGLDCTAEFHFPSAINTQSNLSSSVFCNIANSLSIDLAPYQAKFPLIDKKLVEKRNSIAHGERITISGVDFGQLVKETLEIMRYYKTDLENAASTEAFRR